jgi:hypothetical protein
MQSIKPISPSHQLYLSHIKYLGIMSDKESCMNLNNLLLLKNYFK